MSGSLGMTKKRGGLGASDYQPSGGGGGGAPTDAQYWVGAANATLTNEHNLGALATGLVKNTSGTPSIAVAGTDYLAPSAIAIGNTQVAIGTGTGIAGSALFTSSGGYFTAQSATSGAFYRLIWGANVFQVAYYDGSNFQYINNNPVGGISEYYTAGSANSSWRIDGAGANPYIGFGPGGSTSIAAGGCSVGQSSAGAGNLGLFVTNGSALTEVVRVTRSGTRYQMQMPQSVSNFNFGNGTIGAPTSYDNFKVITYDSGTASTSGGLGFNGDGNSWTNSNAGAGGFVVYAAGTRVHNFLAQGVNLFASAPSNSGGTNVLTVANRSVAPTTDPSGGGILYVESGSQMWRSSSGIITVVAP